jgi:hypothetical protein
MQATVKDSANLNKYLLRYSIEHDNALGLRNPSRRTRELTYFYQRSQLGQLTRLTRAAFLNGFIQESAKKIKELIAQASEADDKQLIYEQVTKLQAQLERANEELKKLASLS